MSLLQTAGQEMRAALIILLLRDLSKHTLTQTSVNAKNSLTSRHMWENKLWVCFVWVSAVRPCRDHKCGQEVCGHSASDQPGKSAAPRVVKAVPRVIS